MNNNTDISISLPLLSPFAIEFGSAMPEKTTDDQMIKDGSHYMVLAPVLINKEPFYTWATIFCSGNRMESAVFMRDHGHGFAELYLASTDENMKILDETRYGNILEILGLSNDNGKT